MVYGHTCDVGRGEDQPEQRDQASVTLPGHGGMLDSARTTEEGRDHSKAKQGTQHQERLSARHPATRKQKGTPLPPSTLANSCASLHASWGYFRRIFSLQYSNHFLTAALPVVHLVQRLPIQRPSASLLFLSRDCFALFPEYRGGRGLAG